MVLKWSAPLADHGWLDGLEILMVCPQSQETPKIIIYEGIIVFFIMSVQLT